MREVLALSRRAEPFDHAVEVAAACAKSLGAGLTCLHVVTPATTIGLPETGPLREKVLGDFGRRIEFARGRSAAFERLRSDAGVVHGHWCVASDMLVPLVARYGLWHDLLVLDRETSTPAEIGSMLLNIDLPTLVVPPRHAGTLVPRHVAIAWNGSTESIRALRSARPLLDQAQRITVLLGKARAAPSDVPPPPEFDLESYFRREGLAFEQYPLDAPHERGGAEILDATSDMQADLLVMGAYGRSRFGEWLLGGATRHALDDARIPLLMRH